LTTEIAGEVPIVLGDRRRMVQLLLNLLSNAIKFTPYGGRIEARIARSDAGEVELSVIDNGIGIRARYVDRIAEPFFQVDDMLARRHEGTGLGL
ncbi:MAG TPA: ATP-binding protein, partial [Alphaproteobacteria bacterium]|nr:ATP-binding protein [Alphaproteobacteria bacterium]